MVQELLITGDHAHAAETGWSSRDTTTPGGHVSANSAWHAAPTGGGSGTGTKLPVSWNFSAISAELASTTTQGLPELAAAFGSPTAPPRRRAGPKSTGSTPTSSAAPETPIFTTPRGLPGLAAAYGSVTASVRSKSTRSTLTSSTPYAHDHIIAERKRREKINQRFVELSAVIPGLKKMDKATILSDATRYVKELREKLSARDAAGVVISRSSGAGVLVKRPCYAPAPPDEDEEGSPAAVMRRLPLPEIDAQLSGNNVMVRILCDNGKGVAARVLTAVEDLHLSIVGASASVLPSPACALNITITAKVEAAFTVTVEEIIVRVSSALSQRTTTHRK